MGASHSPPLTLHGAARRPPDRADRRQAVPPATLRLQACDGWISAFPKKRWKERGLPQAPGHQVVLSKQQACSTKGYVASSSANGQSDMNLMCSVAQK